MPSYEAVPGGIVEVPLTLDNAAGLAAIEVSINYDPDVLELLQVTSGPLGEAFTLSSDDSGGVLHLVFARADELSGGSGRLAILRFRANPGAVVDLYSELTIANLIFSDETAVIDLRQKDDAQAIHGQVVVSVSGNIDNAGNGLPDWWEQQHNLDLFASAVGADDDEDRLDTFMEFAFGGNPHVPDFVTVAPKGGVQESSGERYMTLTFRRRVPAAPLTYMLQEGTNLTDWDTIDPDLRLFSPPVDLGNGMEEVTVRGSVPINDPASPPNGFMRVQVDSATAE